MQSSSSLECTLNWKHSFSSTCRHPPILRVADRASASRSQRSVVPRPWLYVARACTLTLSTQQAILVPRVDQACNCRSDSRSSWWHAFSSLCSNGRCRLMCTCATCYWLNRRVLGNIELRRQTLHAATYIDFPATWDVVMINVGLAQARPNYKKCSNKTVKRF